MNKSDIKFICDALLSSASFLIVSHKNPDGDAIASSCALASLLEKAGKRVALAYPDEPADRLKFILAGRAYMTAQSFESSFCADCVVSLDCASQNRLGKLEEALAGKVDLSIDHHMSNTPFAKQTFTDAHASATSEIVYDIAREFADRGAIDVIDQALAYAIYAGIASDTGNFKYSNTGVHTFEICAKLLQTGIDIAEISRLLFDTCSVNRLSAQSIAISRLKLFSCNRAALITISLDDLARSGLTYDDFDDTVNIARAVEGVEIGVYVREIEKGEYKISLRSNTYANVACICEKYSGGGHLRAAGCSVQASSIEQAADIICAEIDTSLQKEQL